MNPLVEARMKSSLLKPEEVAEILMVPRVRIVRWCKSGKLRAVQVGRFWRVPKIELERVLKEGTRQQVNRAA